MRFRHLAAAGIVLGLALSASGCAVAVYDDPWCGPAPYYAHEVVVYEPCPPPPPVYYCPPPVVFVEPRPYYRRPYYCD